MSTHAYITVECEDGKYRTIYNHFDGGSLFSILEEYYDTQEKAEELVSFGDASHIGMSVEKYVGPAAYSSAYYELSITEQNKEDEKRHACSEFYHRDREEEWKDIQPRIADGEKETKDKFIESLTLWYVFKNGKWKRGGTRYG
jgi:hypothetical protein